MPVPKNKKLPEEIADYITDKIIKMEIAPGERITEATIIKEFEVSNNPVREALQILEKRHLVELVPRRGAWVTKMSADFVQSLFTVMTELSALLVRLCCENRTKEDLAELLKLEQKAVENARENKFDAYFETFGKILALGLTVSRNTVIAQMAEEWSPSLQRAYFILLSQGEYKIEEHLETLQAIIPHVKKRNCKSAEKEMRTYIMKGQENMIKIFTKHEKSKKNDT